MENKYVELEKILKLKEQGTITASEYEAEKKKILKNILKGALIIFAIILVILIIHTIKNYIIITDLQDKISKYKDSSSYHIKSVSTESNGTIFTMNYYKKDNKQVVFMERNTNGEMTKISMYDNGKRIDIFTETKDSKVVDLKSGTTLMSVELYNYLETDNNWQTFLGSIFTKVKSVNYEGKECYMIKEFTSSTSLTFEGTEIYIDKDTGLLVKVIEVGIDSKREYEFNAVDDTIFIEPDISQYTLKENE